MEDISTADIGAEPWTKISTTCFNTVFTVTLVLAIDAATKALEPVMHARTSGARIFFEGFHYCTSLPQPLLLRLVCKCKYCGQFYYTRANGSPQLHLTRKQSSRLSIALCSRCVFRVSFATVLAPVNAWSFICHELCIIS
uniref:Uncharacterized protein n=1 Tax=Anopheles dirus TaxID=7168 RepID=A0A182NYT5_9DIPT